jgi:hypothetical protein
LYFFQFQENQDFREQNERLRKELRSCRGDLKNSKQEMDEERVLSVSYKQRVKRQVDIISEKDKVIDQVFLSSPLLIKNDCNY